MNAALAPTLTAADRCDRCSAQAYVRATLHAGGELLFCAHHGREHIPALVGLPTSTTRATGSWSPWTAAAPSDVDPVSATRCGTVVPPLLIIVGLIGIVVPILPGLLLVLGGVLVWALVEGSPLAWTIFAVSVVITIVGYVLQYTLPGRRMRERGVSSSSLCSPWCSGSWGSS